MAHQQPLISENQNDYPFMWYQNIGSMFYSFVTKLACDRQTYLQTDKITIPKTALAQLLRAVKTTISNKRLLVKFIVVAGQLEWPISPQNLVKLSKQSEKTANVENYIIIRSYTTHQYLCIVFVFCFLVFFISFIALVVNKDILCSLTKELSTVYIVYQFYYFQFKFQYQLFYNFVKIVVVPHVQNALYC